MKIAHINEITQKEQTIQEHSEATAKIASGFSIAPLKTFIYNLGLLHDIGKYQQSFQEKIVDGKNIRVEHAACGAIDFPKRVGTVFDLMAQFCIAGHHTGLPDGGNMANDTYDSTLCGRLSNPNRFDDYSDYLNELKPLQTDGKEIISLFNDVRNDREAFLERYAFLTRYCFSCLTDADSIDTAHFCAGREERTLISDFSACLEKLNCRLDSFVSVTDLQRARSKLQTQVYEKSGEDAQIFLLDMPTGSGKTLCSMKFALERALKTNKNRIIYVIPYNSIIDQTVDVFEELFGDSAQILRHQSSFCVDDCDNNEDYKQLLRNVTENWNAQIIVTTSVQFFESVYKNKRNRLRKLHNMADSVIVFDEVHMMPMPYLQPCLRAVAQITGLLNSEALFLTATMPDFEKLVHTYALPDTKICETVEDKSEFALFRKCEYKNMGEVSADMLMVDAQSSPSALVVVSRRKTAAELYKMASGRKYHLSTYMSAFDRQLTISAIKEDLEKLCADYPDLKDVPEERRVTVISTSLIEAGVDLDFYAVYRELSGLDSILQAGGRCNREGKRQNAVVKVFELDRVSNEAKVNITRHLIKEYRDISDEKCIREYYRRLVDFEDEEIKSNTISKDCAKPKDLPFADYAKRFKMIEDNSVAVAVAADVQSKELIDRLMDTGYTDYRRLQKYTFTVYENELNDLIKQGAVKEYGGVFCLINPDYYNSKTGVSFEAPDYYI